MGMKKSYKKLAVASTIALAAGLAANAQATVDLDAGTGDFNFAQEIVVSASGTPITAAAGVIMDVEATVGFSIGAGTSKYVRYDFVNTRFNIPASVSDFAISTAGATVSIASGGQIGDTYVIVEVAAGVNDVLQADTMTFDPATTVMEVTDQSAATVTYRIFEFASDAISETNVLATRSGDYFGWAQGYTASCGDVTSAKIDVVDPTAFVDAVANTDLFSMQTDVVAPVYLLTGVQVVIEDYMGAGTIYTIDGQFGAFGGAGSVIYNVGSFAAFTVAAGGASASALTTPGTLPFVDLALDANIQVTPNGTVDMVPGSYSVTINPTAGAVFDLSSSPINLGICGALEYSGSTDRMDFAISPASAYSTYIRVTNPSATSGDVVMTVWNDAGDEVTFGLSALAGVASDTLADHSSTVLVNINDVYAACQAQDPSFSKGPADGKLRIQVRGEFGDDAVEGYSGPNAGQTMGNTRTADGIVIQGLAQTKDKNGFFMIKD